MSSQPQATPPPPPATLVNRLELARPGESSWFDADDAPGERSLHTCIHCGLCLTACPTYRETKVEPESPRGRIYLMRALAEGRIDPDPSVTEHLDNCLGCRACETVCPAGVPYGELLEATRGQMTRRQEQRGFLDRLGGWALETLFPERDRLHLAADLMRIGQSPPIAAVMKSAAVRAVLPGFATQGFDMLPPLLPRAERALEKVAARLPAGARMERGERALIFHPAGPARARVAFFTTCVMEVFFPRANQEMVRLLVLAGASVVVPDEQTCCGALHAHSGYRSAAKELARRNAIAFSDTSDSIADCDWIVNGSAGCGAALRDYGHLLHGEGSADQAASLSARVRDVSEVLAELGLPAGRALPSREGRPLRVAVHDPCHLAHAQKVRRPPRDLVRAIPGIDVVELANSDWCCGSAGIYNLTHPEMADRQLAHKLDTMAQSGADIVIASNPGCQLHMTRGAKARGLAVRIAHLAEVLGEAHPA